MHAHTCTTCAATIESGNFDCELDRDHDFEDCNTCYAKECGRAWAERERDAYDDEGPERWDRLRKEFYAIEQDALPLIDETLPDAERRRLAAVALAAAESRWSELLDEENRDVYVYLARTAHGTSYWRESASDDARGANLPDADDAIRRLGPYLVGPDGYESVEAGVAHDPDIAVDLDDPETWASDDDEATA